MINAQVTVALVKDHRRVSSFYYRLLLESEHVAISAQPGQFVHILTRAESTFDPLLRRAFSIFRVKGNTFEILYKVVGKGTNQMSSWQPGKTIDIIGPLGKSFDISHDYDSPDHISLLVGGGVGVPPLAMLSSRIKSGKTKVLIGARSIDDILCTEEFNRDGAQVETVTEDGSHGQKGLVTTLLKYHLEEIRQSNLNGHVYSCGPLPMLRAIALLCLEAKIPCQVSLEENMPCGIGICNGCVIPVLGSGDEYGRYRRVCIDGPVMRAEDIEWTFET